ncbi:MAG: acyltransferase [Acetobacterium sp.]
MKASTQSKSKDDFWQIIRGLCIVLVVLIHCKSGIGYEKTVVDSWNFDYWIIMRQFINFPVAIFIFLAGYFVNIQRVQQSAGSYISNRIKRLVIPFLVWSSFYTLLTVFLAAGKVTVFDSLFKLVFGLSAIQLYFIPVLLQLAVLTPILVKGIQTNRGTKLLLWITPLYLIGLYAYAIIFKSQFAFYQTFFPAWFVFYYAGLWIKIKGYQPIFRKNQVLKAILGCLLGLTLSVIEGYGLLALGFPEDFATIQIKVSSIFYVFTIINLLLVIKPAMANRKNKGLKYLGDHSYGIFYCHLFWIMISYIVLQSIPVIGEVLPLYQLIQLVLVVLFSSITIVVAQKINGKKCVGQFLGF